MAVWRVKSDVAEAVDKVLELIGGINIDQDTKLAVLPTLAKPSHAYFRDNTSPEFLAAVLEILLAKGAKKENIAVVGQSFDDMPAAAIAQKSGLLDACQKFGIMPRDLSAGEFEKAEKFEIAKDVLAADLVINLATEKIGQASAAANLLKVLKKENYLGQKYLSSEAEIIAELEPALKKNLIVVGEAENVQRSNKLTCFTGLVLASKSPVDVDRVFNEIAQSFKCRKPLRTPSCLALSAGD